MSNREIVLALIGQKGGGGKTTTTLCLAAAAAEEGKAAVVIDIDQQANAAKWRDRRKKDNVAVVAVTHSRIKHTVEAARQHGAEFIIIDSPGHSDSSAIEAVRAADIVCVPVKPQMFHFDTLHGMRDLVRIGGDKPTWVVLNELHPSATTQAELLKVMVAKAYPFPVCPVHLSRLEVYATSADAGLTPIELRESRSGNQAAISIHLSTSAQANKFTSRGVHMSKLKNLQQVLNDAADSAPVSPARARGGKAASPRESTEAASTPGRSASRVGKKNVGAWLDPNFCTSLRLTQLRAGLGVYQADLIAEALNDLFRKYDVPTVAYEKAHK